MEPSRSHIIVHVINNCEGPGQYNTNSNIILLDLSFIKFLINTREKQELPGVELGTSGLIVFGCPTEPSIPENSSILLGVYILFLPLPIMLTITIKLLLLPLPPLLLQHHYH